MEQILNEILIIKWLLIALVSIFILIFSGFLYVIYKTSMIAKDNNTFNNFSTDAKDLLEKGLPDKVIEKAKKLIEKYPKHKWAYWYLAEAYQDKEEYTKALEVFTALKKIAPNWEKKYIEPNISEIKDTLKNTKPEVL